MLLDIAREVPATATIAYVTNSTPLHTDTDVNVHISGERENKNLWDDSDQIPPWMKRYFDWHRSERSKLTSKNWESKRYLILRCLRTDAMCGGASDRLSALPYILMIANQTNRLLFIHWSRPAPLEEFLVPPLGGMNWTIPDAVNFTMRGVRGRVLDKRANATYVVSEPINAYWAATTRTVVEARTKGTASTFGDSLSAVYDASRDSIKEASFEQVFSDMWRVLFEPTPPVAAMIQRTLEQHGLESHKYVSAHIRAQHMRNTTGDTEAIKNALHCAVYLQPNAPVYVASDSADVARFGMEYGRRVLNRTLVAVVRDEPPLHLDRGRNFYFESSDWARHPASAYYDTFVDLYLLSYGICKTFGMGGYGRWATMISRNPRCSVNHHYHKCPNPAS
jgi:hypothetical protein